MLVWTLHNVSIGWMGISMEVAVLVWVRWGISMEGTLLVGVGLNVSRTYDNSGEC
jgi:hypothetical protein